MRVGSQERGFVCQDGPATTQAKFGVGGERFSKANSPGSFLVVLLKITQKVDVLLVKGRNAGNPKAQTTTTQGGARYPLAPKKATRPTHDPWDLVFALGPSGAGCKALVKKHRLAGAEASKAAAAPRGVPWGKPWHPVWWVRLQGFTHPPLET